VLVRVEFDKEGRATVTAFADGREVARWEGVNRVHVDEFVHAAEGTWLIDAVEVGGAHGAVYVKTASQWLAEKLIWVVDFASPKLSQALAEALSNALQGVIRRLGAR
jgi:ligand-binding SRPBCC domain-containing protein